MPTTHDADIAFDGAAAMSGQDACASAPDFTRLGSLAGLAGVALLLIGSEALQHGPSNQGEAAWLSYLGSHGLPWGASLVFAGFLLFFPFAVAVYRRVGAGRADAASYALLGFILVSGGLLVSLMQFASDLDHDLAIAQSWIGASQQVRAELLLAEETDNAVNLPVMMGQVLLGAGWLSMGIGLLRGRVGGPALSWFAIAAGAATLVSAILSPSGETDAGSVDLVLMTPVLILGCWLWQARVAAPPRQAAAEAGALDQAQQQA